MRRAARQAAASPEPRGSRGLVGREASDAASSLLPACSSRGSNLQLPPTGWTQQEAEGEKVQPVLSAEASGKVAEKGQLAGKKLPHRHGAPHTFWKLKGPVHLRVRGLGQSAQGTDGLLGEHTCGHQPSDAPFPALAWCPPTLFHGGSVRATGNSRCSVALLLRLGYKRY